MKYLLESYTVTMLVSGCQYIRHIQNIVEIRLHLWKTVAIFV